MKLRYIPALSVIFLCLCTASTSAKEISCRKKDGDAWLNVDIVKSDGRVQSFFYGSIRKGGGPTCEVEASRIEGDSLWGIEQGRETIVALPLLKEGDYAKVSLVDADPMFTIKILTPLSDVCGVSGYIAKTVIIRANKKACDIHD